MGKFIALLRAVNVGGRKVPMAELRELCADIGWADAETYIQSGNVVFAAAGAASDLEGVLEDALKERFGFEVPTMVRSADEWRGMMAANPFSAECGTEASRVLVGVSKLPPRPGAAEAIEAKARAGERAREGGGAIWFHYPEGVGTSKLTPSLIDRLAGSPLTARNWRTIVALGEMAGA